MDGELICINRDWHKRALAEPECPDEYKEEYTQALHKYADQMRAYWTQMMGPRTKEKQYSAFHVCHNCGDIPGAPWTEEDEKDYRGARDAYHASWAPGLYAERVMKMGGKWGDDDRIEHDPRTAKLYRILDKAAEVVDAAGYEV